MMKTAIACKEAGLHFAGLVLVDIDWSILHGTYVEQYVASHAMWHREGLEQPSSPLFKCSRFIMFVDDVCKHQML
jgi:hypothetical protein